MNIINIEDIIKIERCLDESGEILYYILNGTEKFNVGETALVNYSNMINSNVVVEDIDEPYTDLRSKGNSGYLPIEEQLDQLYWDKKNGTSTWEEGIDAVKAAYPKPTV